VVTADRESKGENMDIVRIRKRITYYEDLLGKL